MCNVNKWNIAVWWFHGNRGKKIYCLHSFFPCCWENKNKKYEKLVLCYSMVTLNITGVLNHGLNKEKYK